MFRVVKSLYGRLITRLRALPPQGGCYTGKGENMPHSKLHYHIVWGTKNREPLITSCIESELYGFIRNKAIGLGGYVYALNGIEDHIHLLAHIPRTLPVAQFIGKVKGSSSARINKSGLGDGQFYWQSDYSIFTISEFMIPKLCKYINNQKQHHKNGSTKNWFEQR